MISIFWVLVEKGITSLKLKGGSTLYAVLSKLSGAPSKSYYWYTNEFASETL